MNVKHEMMDPAANNLTEHDVNPEMRLGVMLGTTAIMCVVIAWLLWFLVPSIGLYPLSAVLVHSISIGLTAAVLTVFLTRRLDQQRRTSALWLIGLLIPVSTIAFFVGSTFAKFLLGFPLEPFSVLASTSDTVSLITTVVATAICAGFFLSRDQINRLKLQAAQDGHRVETAKLAMLQAQIEPHMLFNTLANLRALIGVDPERAVNMLDQLDVFLRMTLEGSRNRTNSLANEFAGIDSYLAIMQIRLDERLSYSLDLPEALADINVPSLLIQPVVENAIKHGIEPAVKGGHITVAARRESGVLCLDVVDTGAGIKDVRGGPSTQPSNGFGLHSLSERLPDFGGQPGVRIDSPLSGSTNGTKVQLRVQL